jgi:hypothetical protein
LTLDNGDKQLLREVHGSVARIEGALPFLATQKYVDNAITTHRDNDHSTGPEKRALMSAKTKLILAVATVVTSGFGLLAAYIFG